MKIHRWHALVRDRLQVRSHPPGRAGALQRGYGALGLLIGVGGAAALVVEMITESQNASWLASIVFFLRAVMVALIGAWMARGNLWRPTDDVERRLGYALNIVCALLLVPAVATIVLEPDPLDPQSLAYYGVIACTLTQIIALSRNGFVRIGAAILTLNLVLQLFGLASLDTDLGRVGLPVTFSMVVLIAGLLVRWWFGLILAIGLPLILAGLGAAGVLREPLGIVDTVVYLLVLSASSGVVGLYASALDNAVAVADARARQLRAFQHDLEQRNIRLVAQTEQLQQLQDAQRQLIHEQEARIAAAVAELRERSIELHAIQTPLIRVMPGVIVAPLIGAWNVERAGQFLQTLLDGIESQRAHTAILDVTSLTAVTADVVRMIEQALQSARLLGCRCILVGVTPELAENLMVLALSLEGLGITADLAEAVQRIWGSKPVV